MNIKSHSSKDAIPHHTGPLIPNDYRRPPKMITAKVGTVPARRGLPRGPLPTIALSLRQPWAWLVANGYKDIENRNWKINHRGPCLIHASKGLTNKEYQEVLAWLREHGFQKLIYGLPFFPFIERGGIVGVMTLGAEIKDTESPWYFGPHGYEVTAARPLPFKPCKGRLGFFPCNYEAL
jgi:hypothetical protein